MKKAFFSIFIMFFSSFAFSNELMIYRPENTSHINEVRCWIKIEDENGKDVTYTQAKASYAYIDQPKKLKWYQKSFYLDGGMICHLYLNTNHGEKYKISVYTPKDHVENFPVAENLRTDWDSTVFEYDSSKIENSVDKNYNPLFVIFVSPFANDNGFYLPKWKLDFKAPKYFKFTRPTMQ
ncbi:hypothetical protein [Treponema zioleckii]|uniref:hypothetical protein n=1 Tax=Treponema zioleckii TaxID=331680 RepID=UPI00168BFC5F|nr:hypothetical protein [Treponema zioleckii]